MPDEKPRTFRWTELEDEGDAGEDEWPAAANGNSISVETAAPEGATAEAVCPFEWAEIPERGPDRAVEPKAGPSAEEREPGTPAGEPTPEELAQTLLENARGEAERLVAEAERKAAALREEARRQGFAAGEAEGRTRLEEAAQGLVAVAQELADFKASLYRDARAQVVELVLALVDKVLGPLAESEPTAVVRVVERAIQLLSEREALTIRVHPKDLSNLLDAKPKILEIFDGIKSLTVVEDPSVKRGGCLVQTPATEIDARLDTQLQEIARSMKTHSG